MTSLPRYDDVTNPCARDSVGVPFTYILRDILQFDADLAAAEARLTVHYDDGTNPATMTSLAPLLYRHLPRYYDVTNPATIPSLTPLL